MSCPDENELVLLGEAALDPAARAALEAHIDRCPRCDTVVRELAGLASGDTAGRDIPKVPPRYRLVRRLGSGGMGVVWLAEDRELRRKVAIKVARKTGDASLRKRLLREARMIAGVRHRNVVTVFDVGEYADQPYISMELVDGVTARAWRATAPHTTAEIQDVWCAAATGLVALHERGIVHRDVKPENVLVAADGRVVICDLGLAIDDSATTVTRQGHAVGTLAYMSPEQARGEDIDARSDAYAWSVATWEAITGSLPGCDERSATSGPHAAILTVLRAGLTHTRDDRPTLAVLVERLARVSAQTGGVATRSALRRRFALAAFAVATLAVILGAGVWRWRESRDNTRMADVPADVVPTGAGSNAAPTIDAPPISDDGPRIAAPPVAHDAAILRDAARTGVAAKPVTRDAAPTATTAFVGESDVPVRTTDSYRRFNKLTTQVTHAEAAIDAGDARCKSILASLPAVTPDLGTMIVDRIADAKPRCEMVAGSCASGKQQLAARLRAKGLGEEALAREVSDADTRLCSIGAPGTAAERSSRVQWRLQMANATSKPCTAIVDAAEAANVKPPTFAIHAAQCFARAGDCDRAARYIESDAQRDKLGQQFRSCNF